MQFNRRTFFLQTIAGSGVFVATNLLNPANAQAVAVQESDPQATALGYKADATKADKAKFPKYAAGQDCANCALYQGKAGDATGGCPLFAGKTVTAKGWCSAWAKKA